MVTNVTSKLRVIVDANILVAGIGWPRFPFALLRHAQKGDFMLVLTDEIISEAQDAVNRIIPERSQTLSDYLESTEVEMVSSPQQDELEQHTNLVRDTKDIHDALVAINAKVDYLVTQDKDLTDPTNTTLHEQIRSSSPPNFCVSK
ncbi:MAG: putative toxin-antitoxin system toxin component, PIN family [Anaerolineae bacterium]